MRYLVGIVLTVLAVSASAQDADVAATSQHEPEESTVADDPVAKGETLSPRLRKRTLRQWDPDTYERRLDSSGRSSPQPSAPRHKTDARVQKYRQGVILSSLFVGIGGALIGSGVVVLRKWQNEDCVGLSCGLTPPAGTFVLFSLGMVAAVGGLIGAAVSGSRLSARKRKLRMLGESHNGIPRRLQWDRPRQRLVF